MSHPAARRALLALIAASFLFGATFVVIKSALDDIDPIDFVAWRFLIGAVAAMLIAFPKGRGIWRDGAITGLALFSGYALQTTGLAATSASNSALITGMYVVLTPLIAAALSRKPPNPWVITAAAASFAGIYLLSDTEGLTLSRGDLLTLGCAFAFAFHIIALARYAPRHPIVPYTAVQLAVTAALAFPLSALTGGIELPTAPVWPALLLTGLGVGIGAFLLQIWAQTVVGPGTAAVILAAEPAFGVATAWVVLGERLDAAGWAGTALVVFAIFLVVTRQTEETSTAEAVTTAH
ncbi:MAG TPA: DMT family transporter [Acidimicrobiia bacterium]